MPIGPYDVLSELGGRIVASGSTLLSEAAGGRAVYAGCGVKSTGRPQPSCGREEERPDDGSHVPEVIRLVMPRFGGRVLGTRLVDVGFDAWMEAIFRQASFIIIEFTQGSHSP